MTLFPFLKIRRTGSRETACEEGGTGIPCGRSSGFLVKRPLAGVLAALLCLAGCAAGEEQLAVGPDPLAYDAPDVLEQVTVTTEAEATLVTLAGKTPLKYTIFPATDPDRVLVYLQGVRVESLPLADPVDQGGIHRVYPEVVEEQGGALTRLVIELAEPMRHQVREEGTNLALVFAREPTGIEEVEGVSLTAGELETPETNHPSSAPAQSWEEDGVLEEFGDTFTRLAFRNVVREDGFKSFQLESPPRLVVDVHNPGPAPGFDTLALKGNAFEQLRIGRYPEKVRFVLDGRHGLPEVSVRAEGRDLIVLAGEPHPQGGVSEASATAPDPPPEAAPAPWTPVQVTGIDLVQGERSSDVLITTQGKAVYDVEESGNEIRIVLPGAAIPPYLMAPVDASSSAAAVLGVVPEQAGTGPAGQARFKVRLKEKVPYHVQQEDGVLRLSFQLPAKPPEMPLLPPPEMMAKEPVVQTMPEAAPPEPQKPAEPLKPPQVALPKMPAAQPVQAERPKEARPMQYTGKKISLDFKDADIQNVLRLIAEVSGKNIVISEAVQGKVTIRLMEVPWDMALDVILKTYALDKEELGPNILRVAPFSQLKKEREEALKADEARENVEALSMQIVPVNYARAKDLETLLARFKSKRTDSGILVDTRTNSIILRDLPANIQEMAQVIQELDTQTPQVLIEAKIVELNVDFERELGIQWGALYQAGPATGNPTGLNFPNNVNVGGVVDNVSGAQVPGISSPMVNLPAAIDNTAGGALGLSLGSLTNSFRLDLALSALEKQKRARVLSSPRVATLNNQEARIEQGQEVPFQTTSDEGTKTEFKDAKLRLSVTPQITFDRSIVMSIIVSNDTPIKDPTVGYIIQKKEAQTSVLVKDAETAVIGGIFTNNESQTEGGVPWVKDVPGVGNVFKKKSKADMRTELIIFITPRIIPIKQEKAGEWIQ